jgi:Domain of unknown function (DUF4234)
MTDASDARAHPPDAPQRAPDEAFPPAAHAHPQDAAPAPLVAQSSTAVLDSQPLLGFPGESSGARLSAADEPYPEPPPFGFNAPAPAPEPPARVETAPPPAAETPPPMPVRPAWPSAPAPRPAMQPRELMPASSIPAYRPRLGEGPPPTFGPPGRHRSVAAMVLLSVLTLGFYAVAWHRRVNQEMGDFDPRVHVHPARSAWAVALPLLLGLLATAAAGARVALHAAGISVDVPVTADQALYGLGALVAVPYLVLFLPFSVLAVAMTAERVRLVEEHAGLTADEQLRPASVVGWLLFPVIGGFVALGRQQRHLNRIWDLARG